MAEREIGAVGLRHASGVLREERLRDLQGDRALDVYSRMEADPIVSATVAALAEQIVGAGLTVQAADDTPAAQEWVEFVESCLGDMAHTVGEWDDEWVSTLVYGWSWFEVVAKVRQGPSDDPDLSSSYSDGRVGWAKWAPRPQDTRVRWLFGQGGRVEAMVQRVDETGSGAGREVPIPADRALHCRVGARKGSPEGRSALRSAYEPWYWRSRLHLVSAIGAERNLAGLPKISVPSEILAGATADAAAAKAEWVTIGEQLRVDETAFVMVPSDREDGQRLYDVELLSASGSGGGVDVESMIGRLSREIAMSVLADTIFLGHEQVGTQALVRERNSLLERSLQRLADGRAAQITRQPLRRLLARNGAPPDLWPTIEAGTVGDVDLAALGEFLAAYTGAAPLLLEDPLLDDHLRRLADWPARPDEMDDTRRRVTPPEGDDLDDLDEG